MLKIRENHCRKTIVGVHSKLCEAKGFSKGLNPVGGVRQLLWAYDLRGCLPQPLSIEINNILHVTSLKSLN